MPHNLNEDRDSDLRRNEFDLSEYIFESYIGQCRVIVERREDDEILDNDGEREANEICRDGNREISSFILGGRVDRRFSGTRRVGNVSGNVVRGAERLNSRGYYSVDLNGEASGDVEGRVGDSG
eukprot:TRINITY_DN391_c0_g1_i1.p2 TRINITY_DN391_c0_g1~~TRINITY_DN391_c0_g1_i1.p2  ORF type:complete len:124 (-),score=26.67 TRINITY_DN391_c0_g1_i1:702-1073(-)